MKGRGDDDEIATPVVSTITCDDDEIFLYIVCYDVDDADDSVPPSAGTEDARRLLAFAILDPHEAFYDALATRTLKFYVYGLRSVRTAATLSLTCAAVLRLELLDAGAAVVRDAHGGRSPHVLAFLSLLKRKA